MADFNKIGLFTVRDGRVLLCRKKRGTTLLILPGGCIEAGETAIECLKRELCEELGEVSVGDLEYLGTYRDRAADPGKTVEVVLYGGELSGTPAANSEIRELVWFGEGDDTAMLAPSLANKIFPDLSARGLLPWCYCNTGSVR